MKRITKELVGLTAVVLMLAFAGPASAEFNVHNWTVEKMHIMQQGVEVDVVDPNIHNACSKCVPNNPIDVYYITHYPSPIIQDVYVCRGIVVPDNNHSLRINTIDKSSNCSVSPFP